MKRLFVLILIMVLITSCASASIFSEEKYNKYAKEIGALEIKGSQRYSDNIQYWINRDITIMTLLPDDNSIYVGCTKGKSEADFLAVCYAVMMSVEETSDVSRFAKIPLLYLDTRNNNRTSKEHITTPKTIADFTLFDKDYYYFAVVGW